MSRREWVLLVLFVLLIAGAATAPMVVDRLSDSEPRPPAAAPPPHACPDTPDGEPRHPTEHTDSAAPYTGPGPHPVELVTPVPEVDGVSQYHDRDANVVPLEWQADDDAELQLVVCEYALSADSAAVESCEYLGNLWVQLAPATYRYRVFEARTSRQVTEFTLRSGDGCPGSIEYPEGDTAPARILESVKPADLENALRPVVAP